MLRRRFIYAGAAFAVVLAGLVLGGKLWAAREATARAPGEVLIADQVVMSFQATVDGQTPDARAQTAADKLNAALADASVTPEFSVWDLGGAAGLYSGETLIARIEPGDATESDVTAENLAGQWRDKLVAALGGEHPGVAEAATKTVAARDDERYADWENYERWGKIENKWVPIFSLENTGLYLGAAQVGGPKRQVDKVKGVAELQLTFKGLARIRVYVPVSKIDLKLNRVQGVAVWATGDLRVLKF